MFARDVSHTVANRVEEFIFNDDLKGVRDPEYEEAEKVWANGKHLEAIQLMRDYLKKHPSEQYVAYSHCGDLRKGPRQLPRRCSRVPGNP
jgi:TolA-binding protein